MRLNVHVIWFGYLSAALLIFVVAAVKNGKLSWHTLVLLAIWFPLIFSFAIIEAIVLATWLGLKCLLERVRVVKWGCGRKSQPSAGVRPETRLLPCAANIALKCRSGALVRGFVPPALGVGRHTSQFSRTWNHANGDHSNLPRRCAPRNLKRT